MVHDNWQKAYKELQGEVKKLRQEALQQHDELVKLRRTYEDQIYNLDFDNMPKVKMIALQTDGGVAGLVIRIDNTESEVKILAQRQTEQGAAIANIDAKANDNNAQIHQVVLVQDEHNKSMASITQTAEAQAAEMKRITSVQTEQGKSLTEVNQKATENAASIEQVTSVQTEQGNNIAQIRQDVDKNAVDITSVANVQTEQGESIASVRQSAEANAASISSLASVQTAQGESISNIDQKASDNSASISQIAKVQTEQEKTVASIGSKADANAARIEQVALAQDEQGESIASIESKANANSASISQLASVQTAQGKSIAAIEAKVDEESSEIRLEVQRIDDVAADAAQNAGYARDEAYAAQSTANEAKANSSNGAYIIARINEDGSVVKISADKLELSGYATFASLENEGATSINGANIITGTVDADVLKTGGVGQTGTMLGNNLMFNAGAVKYSDAEARYLFFVDPALYNVFIGVEGGSDAKILRIHSEGNGLFDSYNGERLYLGSIAPGNDLVTRSEVSDMIAAALDGLDVPTEIYAPHISPSSGDYAMPVTVEITNYNSTGDVYYTISGAGNADGTYLYTGPFDIYDTVEDYVTVSAYCRTDHGDSEEASVSYYLSA